MSDYQFNGTNIQRLRLLLKTTVKYNSTYNLDYRNQSIHAKLSQSGLMTPGRSSIKPLISIHNYTSSLTTLIDLLTKREYMYRDYFIQKNSSLLLPYFLTSVPNNNLLTEIKANYKLYDPSAYSSEVSREFFYQTLLYLKYFISNICTNYIINLTTNCGINSSFVTNYLYFYLDHYINPTTTIYNKDLYKTQYRPMRKGITNMIRLHTTGAIALPTEIRVHILASSKDVIHS
jgi:hypothetical protein